MKTSDLLRAMLLVSEMESKQERKATLSKKKQQIAIVRTTTKIIFVGESTTGAKLAKYLKDERSRE